MPRFSVVLPTYNRKRDMKRAMRSIIDQTFEDWELIVIDDGSTDNTAQEVHDIAHPKIKFHRLEHQNNISKVRNFGNSQATGEIIVVQDSDDVSLPDRLELIDKCFRDNPNADVVYHGMYMTVPSWYYSFSRLVRPAAPFDRERIKREQYIPGQIAYTKKVWEEVKYNEEIPLCDDYMFLLELAFQGKEFVSLDRNIYEYFYSTDSVNINGEIDGRRKEDVETILRILKEKYGVEMHALMTKQVGDEILKQEHV